MCIEGERALLVSSVYHLEQSLKEMSVLQDKLAKCKARIVEIDAELEWKSVRIGSRVICINDKETYKLHVGLIYTVRDIDSRGYVKLEGVSSVGHWHSNRFKPAPAAVQNAERKKVVCTDPDFLRDLLQLGVTYTVQHASSDRCIELVEIADKRFVCDRFKSVEETVLCIDDADSKEVVKGRRYYVEEESFNANGRKYYRLSGVTIPQFASRFAEQNEQPVQYAKAGGHVRCINAEGASTLTNGWQYAVEFVSVDSFGSPVYKLKGYPDCFAVRRFTPVG